MEKYASLYKNRSLGHTFKKHVWDTNLQKHVSGTPIYKNMCLGHQFTKVYVSGTPITYTRFWDTQIQENVFK